MMKKPPLPLLEKRWGVSAVPPASRIKFGTGCLKIRRGVSAVLMAEVFPKSCVVIYKYLPLILQKVQGPSLNQSLYGRPFRRDSMTRRSCLASNLFGRESFGQAIHFEVGQASEENSSSFASAQNPLKAPYRRNGSPGIHSGIFRPDHVAWRVL
jgi:hypothetical protein